MKNERITIKNKKIMIHKFSRYLLTLVALLAMTTGAWAQQTTVTWDTETWASGWTSDVKTHTVDGVTITVTGTAEAKNSSGNLYIFVDNPASNTLTFSSDIPIARIEMTKATPSSSLNVSPLDGWSLSSDNTTVIWEGTATKSLVCKTCTLTVTKIKFFLEEPLIVLDDTKTVATMAAMPAYDATVSYELVRDMAVGFNFKVGDGQDGFTTLVKKDGDAYVPSEMTMEEMLALVTATDVLDAQNPVPLVNTVDYTVEMFAADADGKPTGDAVAFNQLVPGTTYVAVATGIGAYDGTAVSNTFQMTEAYDLTLSPASAENPYNIGKETAKGSVTVDGQPATPDADGKIKNLEPTKKVKITTTGPDYIIRKAAVKKAGAATLLTVHVGGQANATLTYEEGQTWGEAIEKYPTENAAFTTQGNWVLCNGITVYDGNWNGVTKGTKVDPNATYTAIDA